MKKVLITGATSGIGLQLAKDYLADGWQVYACGRNVSALETLTEKQNLTFLSFDLSNKAQTYSVLSELEHRFSLIILNAGTCEYIEEGSIDSVLFERVFATNFFGVLYCIQALQAKFSANTHLAIMGSSAAYLPFPRSEAYGASKAAIAYLTHSLAIDLQSQGVTVSLISPGFVQTPLTDKNDFAMPMMVTVQQASQIIKKELARKKIEVHFPKKFSYLLKFISVLPMQLQRKLLARLARSAA